MEERATGLILRAHALTETSLIAHWLTREAGLLATVAKGARRPNSPFRGKLDLFYLADLSFARSRRSELHPLREVMVRNTHPALRRDLGWLQQAAYAARLLERLIESETPVPELFELLLGFLETLPLRPRHPRLAMAWEVKLLAALGLGPNWTAGRLAAGTRALLERCVGAEWPSVHQLAPDDGQTAEARRFLQAQLAEVCGRLPGQREAAWAAGPGEPV